MLSLTFPFHEVSISHILECQALRCHHFLIVNITFLVMVKMLIVLFKRDVTPPTPAAIVHIAFL